MKKLTLVLATTALITVPTLANAEWYVGAGAGLSIGHEADLDSATLGQDAQFDLGWGALGTVGYGFGNGFRSELELGYRANGIDDISLSAPTGGDTDLYTVMANVLYDFNHTGPLKPYIGVGAGWAWANMDSVYTVNGSTLDDSDNAFAAQGIAGLSYAVSEQLDVYTQYQYLWVNEINTNTTAGAGVDVDLSNSLITAGLRYHFGAPEKPAPLKPLPAPAPVAQPEPEPVPQKYMVFFDWNRADITIEAADILKSVAENAKQGKVMKLDLTGHADRSGPDAYNQKLSERRAEKVKQQLIRLGVSASDIATHAKGESDPLVPTDDGVREPQNRRVEIVF